MTGGGSGGSASFGSLPAGGGEPGVTPLIKLSTLQYRNTVRDLLAASGLASLADRGRADAGGVPDDSTVAFRGLDARISSDHIQGYFNVADRGRRRRDRAPASA